MTAPNHQPTAGVPAAAASRGSLLGDAWRAVAAEPVVALLLLTLAAALLRISLLDMPMRLDEATTFNEFVLQPWRQTIGKYWATNNHPLHSVLAKLAVDALGRDPWIVRIPALAAGVLLVPVTYLAASRMYTRAAAWYAAACVALASPLILFSTNARGYSLVALLALLQWLAMRDALHARRRASWVTVAVLGALGVYTHLTMVFVYACNVAWAVVWMVRERAFTRARVAALLWSGCASVAMAVVLYLPFVYLSGLDALIGNDNVSARSLSEMAANAPRLLWRVGDSWSTGLPRWLAVVWGAAAALALIASARARTAEGMLPLVAVVTFFAAVTLSLRLPPPRSSLYLLPLVAAALGGAVALVAARLARTSAWGGWAVWGVATAPLAVMAAAHVTAQPVRRMTETGWMPEAAAMYDYLQRSITPGDAIASFWLPRDVMRYYYLRDGKGRAPLVPETCPQAPSTLWFLVRRGETVETVLRHQRLPEDIAAAATPLDSYARYTIWRAPAPDTLRCPERYAVGRAAAEEDGPSSR